MISAGRTYGILSRGARARIARERQLTDEQLDRATKKMQERNEKWLRGELAKVNKIGLGFPKCVLPIERMVRYRGRMVLSKWTPGGSLCREGKDKIGKIVPETDNRALRASTDQFTKITKEQFLDLLQDRWLVHSHTFRLGNKDDIAKWKKGDKAARAKVIKEYKKFRKRYLNHLKKRFIEKRFVMVDGEIYMKPGTTKIIARAKGVPENKDNQCYDTRLDRLDIYEDCDCAFEDGGVKCDYLHEDKFPKRLGDTPEGKIRLKIYYNIATQKTRLIPDRDNYGTPKGFKPVTVPMLKRLLSRHKDKGGKLLLEYLKLTETRKLATETSPIFRTKDESFAVNMPIEQYLVYFNQHLGKAERREVVKKGIRLTQQEAVALIKVINATPELRLNRHNLPIRVDNFLMRNKVEKDGVITYEYHFPADLMFLEKLEKFINSKYVEEKVPAFKHVGVSFYNWRPWQTADYEIAWRKTGKVRSAIPGVKVDTLKTLLGRLEEHWLSASARSKRALELQEMSFKENLKARAEQAATMIKHLVVSLVSNLFFQVLSLGFMAMLWIPAFRDKVKSVYKTRTFWPRKISYKTRRALFWNRLVRPPRKLWGIRWIPILGITNKKEARFDAKANQLEQEGIQLKEAEEKRLRLDQHPEWKQRILKISEGEKEITAGISEKLLKHPDRLIIGLEKESWKYIAALNEQDMGHPTPFGPSGAGKMMLAKAAAQLVVMDDLWQNHRGKLVAAAEKLYKGDSNSTRAIALLKQYEDASKLMRERYENVTGMQFFRLDKSRMQGTTDAMVGAQQKHLMHMDDAMAHRVVIIIPELPDILRAGEYGGGKSGKTNTSEQFGMNFKEKAEREGAHYSPDTLPKRLLDMLQDPEFEDLFRRIMERGIYLAYRSPKEIRTIAQGRFVQGPMEDAHNVRWNDTAAEYTTRFTLNFAWKKGRPPLGEVLKHMKLISEYVKHREMDKLAPDAKWNEQTPHTITGDDVVEYFRKEVTKRVTNNNAATIGEDIMTMTGEDMTPEHQLRAIRGLGADGDNEIRFPVEEKLLQAQRKRTDSPQVRRIALEIDAGKLGGKSDDPKTAALAMKIARRLNALAKFQKVELKTSENIEAFMHGTEDTEGMLEKVLPKALEELDHIKNTSQQDIIRAMDPSRYRDLAHMEEDAILLEGKVEAAEKALLDQAGGRAVDQARLNEALQMEIDKIVEEHEAKTPRYTPRPKAPKPPKGNGGTPPAGGAAGTGEGAAKRNSAEEASGARREALREAPQSRLASEGIKHGQERTVDPTRGGWRVDPTAAAVIALQTGKGARGPQAVSFHHMSPDAVGRMIRGQLKGYKRSSHLMVGGRINPYALAGLRQSVKQTIFQNFMIRMGLGTRSAARARRAEVRRRRGPARRAMTMIPTRR